MPSPRARAVWPRIVPTLIAVAMAPPLAAQDPLLERAPDQKPGLPPPYYFYRYGAATTSHRTLTAEEAIALALEQASAYRQSIVDERVAEEDVRQARTAYYPQLTAPVTYYGNTPSPGGAAGEPSVPSFAPSNGVHETSAFLVAAGTVDVGGRLGAALRRNRDLLAAAHAGSQAARRALVLATIDAYYGLSLARQKRRLADETLALAESFAEATRELAAGGKAGEAELLRAQAEALRRRDELEQARVGEAAASDALRALTGLSPSVHVGVDRPTEGLPPLDDFGAYADDTVESRPEVAQLDALRQAADQDADAARAERRPQVTYALTGGFDTTERTSLRKASGLAALLNLTVPVTGFGASRSREAQARLRAESLELQRQGAVRQLRQEFLTARATAFAALERIRTSGERARSAEKSLTLVVGLYRQGKATITELLDGQSASSDGRAAYYQAITDYHTARARLAPDPERLAFRPAPQPVAGTGAACSVAPGQAPVLAGLRLGMTLADLRGRVGDVEAAPGAEPGVLRVEIEGGRLGPPPADPAFAVAHASLRFFQARLYDLRIVFSGATTWETKDAFLATAAERVPLPSGPWKAFYDWSRKDLEDAEDLRDLALECDGLRIRLGLGFFSEGVKRTLSPHLKLDDTTMTAAVRAARAP